MSESLPFWERPEIVEMFASRPPDNRMLAWLRGKPKTTRVLDLGSAGGRNTAWLAEQGFDFFALDASSAMIAKTREQVVPYVGEQEALRRVRQGQMQDQQCFASDTFDLIIALGIFHGAQNESQWHSAIAETARVLRPGGEILVAHFSPRSQPNGVPLPRLDGEPHMFQGFDSDRRMLLLEPDELDTRVANYGLFPVIPTSDVLVLAETGYRVTVNAHYKKARST